MSEITLYTARICPYAQRARIALREIGLQFTEFEIDLANKPLWYSTKINPASKVPCLDYKGTLIPESLVLQEFAADLAPGKLLPNDAIQRAQIRYFVERFGQVVTTPFYGLIQNPNEEKEKALLDGLKTVQGLYVKQNGGKGPFFLGSQFSNADIAVAPHLGRIILYGKEGILPKSILTDSELETLRAYAKELMDRPTFKETFPEEYLVESIKKRLNK